MRVRESQRCSNKISDYIPEAAAVHSQNRTRDLAPGRKNNTHKIQTPQIPFLHRGRLTNSVKYVWTWTSLKIKQLATEVLKDKMHTHTYIHPSINTYSRSGPSVWNQYLCRPRVLIDLDHQWSYYQMFGRKYRPIWMKSMPFISPNYTIFPVSPKLHAN